MASLQELLNFVGKDENERGEEEEIHAIQCKCPPVLGKMWARGPQAVPRNALWEAILHFQDRFRLRAARGRRRCRIDLLARQ